MDEAQPDERVREQLLGAMDVLRSVIAAPEILEQLDAQEKAAFFNAAWLSA